MLHGFILGLLLSGLGFALKYREIQAEERAKAADAAERKRKDDAEIAERLRQEQLAEQRDAEEQRAQVARLDVELNQNLAVADELRKNTIVMLGEFRTLSQVLRTSGIKILPILFPAKNLDMTTPETRAGNLADDAMDRLRDSGLLSDQLEIQKVTAAANAISQTIQATISTIQSLQDPDRQRYVFSDSIWKTEHTNIERVVLTDLTLYQASYGSLELLRANYDVLTQHYVEYLNDLQMFFDPTKHSITRDGLRKVLAVERYTYSLLITYGRGLSDQMHQLKSLSQKLRK